MGKRGRKNKKKRSNYSKKKFKNVFCSCRGMCGDKPVPTFCFETIYKSNPDIFVNHIYPTLIGLSVYFKSKSVEPSSMSVSDFNRTFCASGVCSGGTPLVFMSCPSHEQCYAAFIKQVHRTSSPIFSVYKNGKRKRKKKGKKFRTVFQPFPTFFSRQDEKFQNAIRKILYGDNDIEQDSNQETDGAASGDSDRDTKGRESEVQ
jgi:hypothetical protein